MKPSLLLLLSLAISLLVQAPASAQATDADLFPRPAELEDDVQFWLRIYTEVDGNAGLIHDSRHLEVVYQVVRFPEGASSRTRDRTVEKAKRRYRDIVRHLARGNRQGLSNEQARILGLFGDGVSNETLRTASSRLRFQLGQADKFRSGLIRSGAWRDYIRATFRDMGLPEELAALPHVESSFTPHAYSRVGAAGLWQFTRSTGRRYMRVDHVVDERLEPLTATVAAARLLEHNHRATGTWPLALTAYNHGAAGMRRASRKMGTKDIAVINRKYRSRTFGFASRNFYVEFLAALEIDQNPEKYFGELPLESPPEFDSTKLPFYASARGLAKALDIETSVLKKANPALRGSVWDGAKRVPKGFEIRVPRSHLAEPIDTLVERVPDSARFAAQTRDSFHKIRRGETLSSIASRYRTSVTELQSLNGLRSRHRIRAGQRLRLPEKAGSRSKSRQATRASVSPQTPPADGVYVVRRGDNLALIASRFGIAEQDLLDWNPIRNRHRIAVGQQLRVKAPVAGAHTPAATPAQTSPAVLAETHPEALPEFTPPPSARADFDAPGVPIEAAAAAPSVADAAAAELAQGNPAAEDLLADPGDYSVASNGTIEVQAAETLGHYAEWLDVRASRLRSLNHMRYGTPLALGKPLRLDFSQVTPKTFEQRRSDHHRALQGEFFERFQIDGTKVHVMQRGDSLWTLAQRTYRVPLWLIRQYNPDLDFASLQKGTRITIPLVKRHSAATSGIDPAAAVGSSEARLPTRRPAGS
jgi:membrane-bound lytic murein transglycosylase D